MQKLIPVEEAKALMREAAGWSMWSWLTEKRRLRTTADAAWEALEELERKAKDSWADDLKHAYRELEAQAAANGDARGRRGLKKAQDAARDVDPQLKLAVKRVKDADDEWRQARETAEATFDEAERRMSTSMACAGALQAIQAWELTERAIRRAEALTRRAVAYKE